MQVTRWEQVRLHAQRFAGDCERVFAVQRARGTSHPVLSAVGDSSLWALALLRAAAATRAAVGTSLGLSTVLRTVFHLDVWTDDIGPGLRLPHPFNIVIGDGVKLGRDCTLMHNVTIQRGVGTSLGDRVVVASGATILRGATVENGALIGAASVVRGRVPEAMVAVGIPARVTRAVREGEV